jgi:hypothetical protein
MQREHCLVPSEKKKRDLCEYQQFLQNLWVLGREDAVMQLVAALHYNPEGVLRIFH